jgi:iron complex transport system substrate-binding protein
VLAACGSSPAHHPGRQGGSGFPVTVQTASGPLRIASRPTAIVSLSPTATEMLYAIGAGSQVKAVDADSNYPPQAPHTKLSGLTPNIEAIVAKRPDLVIVSYDATSLSQRLGTFHVPVLNLPAAVRVSDVYREFTELGVATGHTAAAQREDRGLQAQLRAIAASVPHPAKAPTYYYELDPGYYSATSATFVGQLLGLLGLRDIADAGGVHAAGGYPQLSAEFVIRANPDYIFLADTICCHQSARTVASRPGFAGLRAVREHHVVGLNDDIASRWGPRIVDLLRAVAAALRGH